MASIVLVNKTGALAPLIVHSQRVLYHADLNTILKKHKVMYCNVEGTVVVYNFFSTVHINCVRVWFSRARRNLSHFFKSQ